MAEMDALFQEMMGTLQDAMVAMREEVERLPLTSGSDRQNLLRLADSARAFVEQSSSLFLMMLDRDADPIATKEVEDLSDFFQAILAQIELKLERALSRD